MLSLDCLRAPGLHHGFFGRRGGVSAGTYDSLNCGFGSDDDATRVAENRRRALKKLGMADRPLFTVHQVHSARVAIADTLWDSANVVEADAMVTRRSGLVLGILTADCTPVLFYDPEARVIGAAHAGWRGAKAGVLENTVAEMEGLGANRSAIRAGIGPTIQQPSYEVSDAFKDDFLGDDPQSARFFIPGVRDGHPLFDLPGFVQAKLEALGLAGVETVGVDTLTKGDQYFSYRASQRAGLPDYGRNLSAIAMGEG